MAKDDSVVVSSSTDFHIQSYNTMGYCAACGCHCHTLTGWGAPELPEGSREGFAMIGGSVLCTTCYWNGIVWAAQRAHAEIQGLSGAKIQFIPSMAQEEAPQRGVLTVWLTSNGQCSHCGEVQQVTGPTRCSGCGAKFGAPPEGS